MKLFATFFFFFVAILRLVASNGDHQPLSKIAIQNAVLDLHENAHVEASPTVLGLKVKKKNSVSAISMAETKSSYGFSFQGQSSEWVAVKFSSPKPSIDDWIGVFSPGNFK